MDVATCPPRWTLLSRDVEDNIVSLTNNGYSSRKIAIRVQKRQNATPKEQIRGRRKLLTEADARLMMAEIRQNKSVTPKNTTVAKSKQVSECTASAPQHWLCFSFKKNKPALSEKNQKARMKFAREHNNWTTDDWKGVIWSDESKFNRFQSEGKQYCCRRPGDTIQRHHVKHGGGSIMVWGCFTWWHIGPLQKIDGIMKKEDYLAILQTHLPEFVAKSAYPEDEVVFQ
ncbi:uncharacterized protein LOC142235852 [Haematobia irritans]|uniref:uncharacterized protein LOC142235852 n=1 Tax=Haematobia irritans TaxID=7368 RepID=UPI003F507622